MKIKQLLESYESAIEKEKDATENRLKIESEIFESVKSQLIKTEGQETIKSEGYEITVNQPMSYKLNDEKYRKLAESMPEDLQFHRTKLELDKTKYSSLILQKDNSIIKKYIKKIQDCVEIKPGKVAIKIKEVK